ncbi:hypothetical protein GLYMA_16G075350v4 [Glycine max]|nr:hypothetical protein GLYMA_16G075350v4 [Glycine max]KAH1150403.1 hypothetical protein GYH30_044422 [Glycine max]
MLVMLLTSAIPFGIAATTRSILFQVVQSHFERELFA